MSSSLPVTATSSYARQQQSAVSRGEVFTIARLPFRLPGIRPSYRLEPGAARGECKADGTTQLQMKALLPNTNIGLTTAQKPTVFFQISKTSVPEAQFILLNETGKESIYATNFPLNGEGGVMSFTLPADAPALEVGKEYHWEVEVLCVPDDHKGNPRVQGAITRVQPSPTFASQLQAASPRDRVALYADQGYWYDTLKALADLRSANPNDQRLVRVWEELLNSAALNTSAK